MTLRSESIRKELKILSKLLSFALLVTSLQAASPTVGEKAPDFELRTVEEKSVRLSDVTSHGPVVLVVLRGYPGYQCPFCNRQAQDFISKASSFASSGARVILVYPGPPQELNGRAKEFLTGKSLPEGFDLVLDPGYQFTNLYGLRWDAQNETAYPATFVLDRNGRVNFCKIAKAHGGRSSAQEVLEMLPKPKLQR